MFGDRETSFVEDSKVFIHTGDSAVTCSQPERLTSAPSSEIVLPGMEGMCLPSSRVEVLICAKRRRLRPICWTSGSSLNASDTNDPVRASKESKEVLIQCSAQTPMELLALALHGDLVPSLPTAVAVHGSVEPSTLTAASGLHIWSRWCNEDCLLGVSVQPSSDGCWLAL